LCGFLLISKQVIALSGGAFVFEIARDKVCLLKVDGKRIENIEAIVQPDKIIVLNGSLPIEEGDTLLRTLPSGLTEAFTIVDRGYCDGGGFAPHYQVKVRKQTGPSSSKISSAIYYLDGTSPHFNLNSAELPSRLVSIDPVRFFNGLRDALKENIKDPEQLSELLKYAEAMESSRGTGSFLRNYKDFIAMGAEHLSRLTPFLPALAQML
jgi:hypothetical protein